ncbi:MAG: hypothetical protein GY913_10405 [Proteobacteria bacterium]|nr:hypothetical protein [Pseudomonadota bacterium]MCP4917324.1 hypothetical protein [Pseudomonadota bacterium]
MEVPLGDCDDASADIWPDAPDPPGDCVDQDCDGERGPESDEDGDGLDCLEEQQRSTDPLDPDTDGDGLRDGEDPDPLSPEPEQEQLDDHEDLDQDARPPVSRSGCIVGEATSGLVALFGLLAFRRRR